jgi:hypothetical protein
MLQWLRAFTRALRAGADASVRSEYLLRRTLQMQIMAELTATPRYSEPKRLLSSGYKVYSQNDEDGIIAEIFRRIGTTSRRFIEFGVQDGLESNSTFLLLQGWNGVWLEGSPACAAEARKLFKGYAIKIMETFVTAENADAVIAGATGDGGLDLLSIDIDSNEYWVWKAITSVRPRVVVIEYNATLPPFMRKTISYNPGFVWDGSNYSGASLGALAALGEEKGYALVGCCAAGVNAFFVRSDLAGDKFCAPFTAANHYEPPRYYLAGSSGHRPGMGPWIDV